MCSIVTFRLRAPKAGIGFAPFTLAGYLCRPQGYILKWPAASTTSALFVESDRTSSREKVDNRLPQLANWPAS